MSAFPAPASTLEHPVNPGKQIAGTMKSKSQIGIRRDRYSIVHLLMAFLFANGT
jgi:hypothetical protein